MNRSRAVLLAATGSLVALLCPARANAYCRTKACDTDPSYGDVWDEEPQPTECVRNAQGCYIQGTPLWWPSTCLGFAVHRAGSESDGIEYDTASQIIEAAFAKWQAVDCGGGVGPSFRVENQGPVDCRETEYNQEAGNANAFMFRDDHWPYTNALDTLALTTVTYNVETAEIYDSDVEVNTAQAKFTTTEMPPADGADLDAVVTHEVGHFLGLAHSEVSASTMRSIGYQLGTVGLRTLAPDDVAGICEIYPPGRDVGSSCEPRHGFAKECAPEVDEGCALRRPPSGGRAPFEGVLGAALGIGLLARRARRRKAS